MGKSNKFEKKLWLFRKVLCFLTCILFWSRKNFDRYISEILAHYSFRILYKTQDALTFAWSSTTWSRPSWSTREPRHSAARRTSLLLSWKSWLSFCLPQQRLRLFRETKTQRNFFAPNCFEYWKETEIERFLLRI